jgi:hypothetical protein
MVMWARADTIVEPRTATPIYIKGAHVIAAVPHDVFRNEQFDLLPFGNRLWVSLCVSPHAEGCVRPKLAELRDDRWIPENELLRGLPPLDAINLWADPKSPFRGLGHEEDAPTYSERDICLHDNLLHGTLSIAQTAGTFPTNAWMVLRRALDHSGDVVDDLYRWGGQWLKVLSGRQYPDAIDRLLPWRNGAVVAQRRVEAADRHNVWQLLYVTGRRQTIMIRPQPARIELGIVNDELIAVTGLPEYERNPTGALQVRRWSASRALRGSREIPVSWGESALLPTVRIEDRIEVTWRNGESMMKVTVELDDELTSSEEKLPLPRYDDTVEMLELPPPYQGEAAARGAWTVNGRRVWRAVVKEPTPVQLLLSDRPTQETWTPTPATVELPTVEKCMQLSE